LESFFQQLKFSFFQQKFTFKKFWGQSFLVDENIIKKIVNVANLKPTDYCVEIGAGAGFLSWALAAKVKELVIIEKDKELIEFFRKHFSKFKNITIINADFLKINLSEILAKEKKYKIIANLPYSIASLCINKILTHSKYFKIIYVMLQSEIAKRITSKPGNKTYGSLSVFVQCFCETGILFKVSANSFYPVPKVESSFVFLQPAKTSSFKEINPEEFSKFLKYCFSQRRKKLKNILSNELNNNFLNQEKDLFNLRPEQISVSQFKDIFKKYKK